MKRTRDVETEEAQSVEAVGKLQGMRSAAVGRSQLVGASVAGQTAVAEGKPL